MVNAPEAISDRSRRRPPIPTRVRLPAMPVSARRARDFVRAVVGGAEDGRVSLVTSELVTNAVVHAGTAIELVVEVRQHDVLVEVHDLSDGEPRGRAAEEQATGGRGLALVAALADEWGVRREGGGKAVWAVIRLG